MKRLNTTTTTPSSSSPSSSLRACWPTRAPGMVWSGVRRQQHQQRTVVVANAANNINTSLPQRAAAAAAAAALLVLTSPAAPAALADDSAAPTPTAPQPTTTTVYFGNGCFWGRQKDFVETELRALSRPPERVTAVAGYAAGSAEGPGGKVCYHFNDPRQVYERLGHAEVVAVELDGGGEPAATEGEMRQFTRTYFSQFRRLRDGRLQRLDPQDAGPGYRNVVGLPGGVNSPLFEVLRSEAPAGVQLREGKGRAAEAGGGGGEATAASANASNASKGDEGDEVGVIWVVDSAKLPFYRAEQYHQYHRGMEGSFPPSYLRTQREAALKAGRIDPTGCLEFPF